MLFTNFANDTTLSYIKKKEINETEKRKLAYSKLKLKTIKEIPEVTDGDITIGCNQQNKNKV